MTAQLTNAVDHWTSSVVRPGDLVVVAQGVGEPTALLQHLVHSNRTDVEVFVGLSHSGVLVGANPPPLVSFGAMGPLAQHASRGRLSIIPCHFVDLPRLLPLRAPGRLVVLVQVCEMGADGRHSLGMAVDYTYDLLDQARAVVAEVNSLVAPTSAPRLDPARFDAVVRTSRPLPTLPVSTPSDAHRRIAGHLLPLVPDRATIQLGIGGAPSAIGTALGARRDLYVRSTLVGDWLLDLARAGALSLEPGSVVISEAAGSAELYDFVAHSSARLRPVGEVLRPAVNGQIDRLFAINAALQVDLTGQVNAEQVESGYVGGIGGQPEFLRAAQRSSGGRSVIVLPATAAGGTRSRIVRRLQRGTVTTPRSVVDLVVTEFGVADLRGRSLEERAKALIEVAAPRHRAWLRDQNGNE